MIPIQRSIPTWKSPVLINSSRLYTMWHVGSSIASIPWNWYRFFINEVFHQMCLIKLGKFPTNIFHISLMIDVTATWFVCPRKLLLLCPIRGARLLCLKIVSSPMKELRLRWNLLILKRKYKKIFLFEHDWRTWLKMCMITNAENCMFCPFISMTKNKLEIAAWEILET